LVGVALIALTSLAACASGSAHQNFRNIMNAKVGTNADSPSARAARNPDTREEIRTLQNGNMEEGYRLNRTCRYYFEIDKSTRKIVGWRYEGTEQECVVVP
jgi:hypothetical protein